MRQGSGGSQDDGAAAPLDDAPGQGRAHYCGTLAGKGEPANNDLFGGMECRLLSHESQTSVPEPRNGYVGARHCSAAP